MSEDDVDSLYGGPVTQRSRYVRARLPTTVTRVTTLLVMVVGLTIALIITLVDRPRATLATMSATDTLRIACAELADINPNVKPLSADYDAAISRLGAAASAGDLAAVLDPGSGRWPGPSRRRRPGSTKRSSSTRLSWRRRSALAGNTERQGDV
jgi:hypothetical protein